jgi:ATP synthase protein I
MENRKLSGDVEKSAKELMKARKEKAGFWHYASMIGVGGWLFVVPVVAGAYLGKFLDKKMRGGISWTLTFIILGIVFGIYNIWYFYIRESE